MNFKACFRYHHRPFALMASSRPAHRDVTLSYDIPDTIVVLPALRGRLRDRGLRRWLSRSRLDEPAVRDSRLGQILGVLGRPESTQGLGALRMWGQTGDRPTVWIAAADPVYLEPRLDHLCLHALDGDELPVADLRRLIDHLQATLGEERGAGFVRLGRYAYLRSSEPFPTATHSARKLHREVPNDHMPVGPAADGYRKLVSEIEMALHEHPVNLEREERGLRPVNSFWLWGGGHAPESRCIPHPPLFADDPLLRGFWTSVGTPSADWPGSIPSCLDRTGPGFVAVLPDDEVDSEVPEQTLSELRQAVDAGRIDRLTLLTADGIRATVRRRDRYRFWRGESQLLGGEPR